MNRFFPIALVTLGVMAILAWLGVRVLHTGPSAQKVTYSQVIHYAEHNQLVLVVFRPTKHEIDATMTAGETIVVSYPTDQSAVQFQNLLHQKHIKFRSSS